MRLSTRDLFAVLAFVAVISWCAGQVGYGNPLFWIALVVSLVVSLVLAAIFVRWSAKRDGRAIGLIAALCLGAFCTLSIGSLATLLVAGLFIVAELICLAIPPPSNRVRYRIAMMCIAAAFVATLSLGNTEFRKLEALRKQYPIVSLNDRFDYEVTLASTSPAPLLGADVTARLAKDEERLDRYGNRHWGLQRIHDRRYDHFVRASGFGVTRMARPRVGSIDRMALRDIPFNASAADSTSVQDDEWRIQRIDSRTSPTDALHDASRFDFLDTEGFGGIIAPRTQVAGFIEHAFHRHPLLARAEEPPKWSIDRVELVSLLKFNEPRVYVLDHLPRMDQLAGDDAPTRALDEFETPALESLRTDQDLVVANEGDDYRMLGSLRAAKQCLDCHNVQRGELLGAFSYRLTLASDQGKPAPESVQE